MYGAADGFLLFSRAQCHRDGLTRIYVTYGMCDDVLRANPTEKQCFPRSTKSTLAGTASDSAGGELGIVIESGIVCPSDKPTVRILCPEAVFLFVVVEGFVTSVASAVTGCASRHEIVTWPNRCRFQIDERISLSTKRNDGCSIRGVNDLAFTVPGLCGQ
jgi:hypothetical protein